MLEVEKKVLRRRLLRSLATGAVLYLVAWAGFLVVQKGPVIDGAPALLRKSFFWNEAVWSRLHSNRRTARTRVGPGGRARYNGDLGLMTPLDLKDYRIEIESGDQELSMSLAEIRVLPKIDSSFEFKCIEGWSEVMAFGGPRFSTFLEAYHLGRKPDGSYYRYVALETPDGEYYVSIDMESMLHPQTLLAYEMNGADLPPENGAPLRLVIPVKYGIKNLKRIGRIWFSDERPPDYWAELGYDWYSGL